MRARIVVTLLVFAFAPAAARAQDAPTPPAAVDPLEAYRARFRAGLLRYETGDVAGAIVEWEPIYQQLGPERGYRVAFDLGRAYDVYGDPTRAAEHFEAYLGEVEHRRASEALPDNVLAQATEAEARLRALGATLGRVEVASAAGAVLRIDGGQTRAHFAALYLQPGRHVLLFTRGTSTQRRDVALVAGQRLVLRIDWPTSPVPRARSVTTRTQRPFSAAYPLTVGGVALASAVLPAVFYAQALGIRSAFNASTDPVERDAFREDYTSARVRAYAGLAATSALGAAALVLTTLYTFGGRKETQTLGFGVQPGGASATWQVHY